MNHKKNIDDGKFKFLPFSPIPTPNVNAILSRFAYYDNNLCERLRNITESDSDDCIFVELLHHREDRLANVLVRPNLYNYELPYVSNSKSDNEKVISINDIYIKIESGQIKLRSKSLNKEIKPRYSNAYNYSENQLPVINFLGDYQSYGTDSGFKWDWGFLNENNYLPRVEYKEFILAQARWKINKNSNITIEKLKEILNNNSVPELCTIKRRDNILVIDTKIDLCLNTLVTLIKKESILLYEYIEPLKLPNENGEKFSAEFILPFTCDNYKYESASNSAHIKIEKKRRFLPGEEWSYFKFYTSHKYADKIIKNIIGKYLKHISESKCLNNWHFIRYNDPSFHIRFRYKGKLNEKNITYLNKLLNDFINQGIIYNYEISSYNREIERYGVDNIKLTEQYFYHDSLAVLKLISIEKELDEDMRWKIAVLSLHLMMTDFGISEEERVKLFDELYNGLLAEHVDVRDRTLLKDFQISIGNKYRSNRQFFDDILRLNNYTKLNGFVEPLLNRSQNTTELIDLIRGNTKLKSTYLTLVKDYVHMNMNRLFITKARMHEMVLYNFMSRSYNSILVSAPPTAYCCPPSLFLVLFKNKIKNEPTRKNVCFGRGISSKRIISKSVL